MSKHPQTNQIREMIVDEAIQLAKEKGTWEAVRFAELAKILNLELVDVYQHFIEKDKIIDALLDRADKAMIQAAEDVEVYHGSAHNLHALLMIWIGELNEHRIIVKQMLCSKFEIGHLHSQLPALLRMNRTVQWWREAAKRKASFCARIFDEVGLSAIFLLTVMFWLNDESENAKNTSEFLRNRLDDGGQVVGVLKSMFSMDFGTVRKPSCSADIIAK